MTEPRRLVPGATYSITRRCTQRHFFLRPDAETNQVFLYCLAVAAERTGIEVHAADQMSNHWHGVVSDPERRLSEFLHLMHRLIASAMNEKLGRKENFWAAGHTSVVALESAEDVLDEIAYVIANPTRAGLVSSPKDWPGFITLGLGEVHTALQPKVYFRSEALKLPARATLRCTIPSLLRDRDERVLDRQLRERVAHSVDEAKRRLRKEGRRFLGASAVRATSPWQQPTSREAPRARAAAVAARNPELRERMIKRLKAFRQHYGESLRKWRAGVRSVVFPYGTYLMQVLHGASVSAFG